jgi:hypothetical protein
MKLVVFVSDQVNLLCTESGTNKSKERKRERKRERFFKKNHSNLGLEHANLVNY